MRRKLRRKKIKKIIKKYNMDLDNLNLSSTFSLIDLSLEELVNRKRLTTIQELQNKKLTNSENAKYKVKIKEKIKQI